MGERGVEGAIFFQHVYISQVNVNMYINDFSTNIELNYLQRLT